MPVGDRDRIVVGLVAHQRLRRHFGAGLVAGIEGCRRPWTHGGKIPLQPFPDRLALAAQPVMLTLAALLFQPGVERIPCRTPRRSEEQTSELQSPIRN